MDNVNNCFVLPKELLTKEYAGYSLKSKLLFSIVLTEADNGTAISELATLIDDMGSRKISTLYQSVHKEMSAHQRLTKSEGM